MNQVLIIEKYEFDSLRQELKELRDRVALLEELVDDDIRGTKAAAKVAGISARTLETERDRPGTKIVYKKSGRAVSYSLKSLVAYKKGKRLSTINLRTI